LAGLLLAAWAALLRPRLLLGALLAGLPVSLLAGLAFLAVPVLGLPVLTPLLALLALQTLVKRAALLFQDVLQAALDVFEDRGEVELVQRGPALLPQLL